MILNPLGYQFVMKCIKKSFQYGKHVVDLETGRIAKQADASVLVKIDGTVVLATVVIEKNSIENRDFLPLTVNYQEKYYSNGRFPGGFIKRENRPSVQEILISRLIDRSLRPLFPSWLTNEIQVIITALSLDGNIMPDIPALIAAAAAIEISGLPISSILSCARVAYIENEYIINPTIEQLKISSLDLVVSGTENSILMVESEANELDEDVILRAIEFGHNEVKIAISAIKEFSDEIGKPKLNFDLKPSSDELLNAITEKFKNELENAYNIYDKQKRCQQLDIIRKSIVDNFISSDKLEINENYLKEHILKLLFLLEKKIVRDRIFNGFPRIDGRDPKSVRPITIDLGLLPRTHGSALFTRGETQALVVATLGTEDDAQIIDAPIGESHERFMLHYNFPPYCTGEIGNLGSPRRREIGHGNLAKRALSYVIPKKDEFPYVIRLVSEITESNGSSSMASVCGGTLALMDAGIPIKLPVAGVAMGLIKNGSDFVVLTDILGDEDKLGDMDFKVAGTVNGITALQMDIKISDMTSDVMKVALNQAREARIHILETMITKIEKPRDRISDFAPRITTMKIEQDKIRDVIGKGGSVIRGLIEETGTKIDIKDDGTVTISSFDKEASDIARKKIEEITANVVVGSIYSGKVSRIMDFGAVVSFLSNKDGLVHISQIAAKRINNVRDVLQEGQEVNVKIIDIDRTGRIKLSIKEAIKN